MSNLQHYKGSTKAPKLSFHTVTTEFDTKIAEDPECGRDPGAETNNEIVEQLNQ